MTLQAAFRVGNLRCHTLEGGVQRLDGGAMFGVVPQTALEQTRSRRTSGTGFRLAMRCLLIEHPDGLVLIDTALGNKENAKFHDIYGVENQGLEGATQLEDALASAGFLPEDVALGDQHASAFRSRRRQHDHRSGRCVTIPRRHVRPTFPNATLRRAEGRARVRPAHQRADPCELPRRPTSSRSRRRESGGCWRATGQMLPGISVRLTPGHVPFQQAVIVTDRGETAAFMADLIPTTAHLPLPWIMGYDLEPLRTLETKRAFLRDAVAGGWRLIFEHDPAVSRRACR